MFFKHFQYHKREIEEWSKWADKASLLTASGMLLHAFPLMSISSLREFPENCVYRHGGFNCFIKYLHRKLLTTRLLLDLTL
jgi:hypothetical protein